MAQEYHHVPDAFVVILEKHTYTLSADLTMYRLSIIHLYNTRGEKKNLQGDLMMYQLNIINFFNFQVR